MRTRRRINRSGLCLVLRPDRAVRWSGAIALGIVLLLAAGPVWSQSVNTGTVTGSVILPDDTATPGASVSLTGPALVRGSWTAVSDSNGRFVFLSVPPGTYTVSASLAGFNTQQIEDVTISAGVTVPIEFKLEIAPASGEIVVTSVAPMVDTRSSTIDTTFSDDLLASVPTARDSFYDLALTAPGMSSVGAAESWLPSPSAFGSAANDNIFLVNGVNTTNPRGAPWGSLVQVNYDTVQEVNVLALGSEAEYGSFSGAAIDVITKSGSNEFSGSVAYYGQSAVSNNYTATYGADWLWSDPGLEIVTYPVESKEFSLTIGGPIVRDKLWFYAGFDHREGETDEALRPLNVTNDADIYDVKLTGDLGVNHRAWLGLHYEDNFSGNVTWGPFSETMFYDSPVDNKTAQFEYQWVVSDRDLFGFKYLGFQTDQSPTITEFYGHPGFINWWKWIGGRAVGTGGDFPYVEAQKSKRDTLQADFTHYADDWAGQHEIKFGAQYTTANGDWMGGYFQGYQNLAYPYGWGYSRDYMNNAWWSCDYTWCVAPDDTVAFQVYKNIRNPWLNVREANSTGFFVDDQWVVNDKVTLNLGMRYDRMEANYGQGKIYEFFDTPSDADHPTTLRSTQGFDVYDFKTWSPRLGVAWTLTDDAKTVLRAHIGRYYSPLTLESLRRLGPDMGTYTQEQYMYWMPFDDVDLNGNDTIEPSEIHWATSQLGSLSPARFLGSSELDASWRLEVEPGTDSPYTDQFNISIQHQLSHNLALEATYIYKKTKNFLVLTPYNLATGEYFEWESRPYTTWTGYETEIWSVVIEDFNGDGVINGLDAGWPSDGATRGWRAQNLNSWNGHDIKRTYQGVQLVLTKRYADRWQMLAALNWTNTDGFYPRTVNQNWYIDGPLTMDTPFGSTPNHFQNNLSGPALMTPEWMFKISGSYTIPVIETDVGLRIRYDSGRAIFAIDDNLGPFYAGWMGVDGYDPETQLTSSGWGNNMVAQDPDDAEWRPSTTIIDLNLRKRFAFGSDWGITASIDALNVLNEDSPNDVGFKGPDYGMVYSIVTPRRFRLGLKIDF